MSDVLATLYTITTYGTWVRGDHRGWVDDGVVCAPNPVLENHDRNNQSDMTFYFENEALPRVANAVGESLTSRLDLQILAFCLETWHCHFVVGANSHAPDKIVKCAEDAARWNLRIKRKIWTAGYDKRFCYDETSVLVRVRYVEEHNLRAGNSASPWSFITPPSRKSD